MIARWRVWTLAAVAGAALGALVALLVPKSYEATSLLMVTDMREGEPTARPQTTIRVLAESRVLAEQVLDRFREPLRAHNLTAERFLAGHLRVEDVRGTNLLRLHVRLPDAQLAHDVCEFLTTSLVEHHGSLQQRGTSAMTERLNAQLAAAEKKVGDAEQRLERLRGDALSQVLRKASPSAVNPQTAVVDLLLAIEAEKVRVAKEYERAERLLSMDATVLQIADSASRPERPVWPKPFLFAAMGALLALLTSGVAVVLGLFPPR